jgi:eukaryotic-like serine/threonine-protein kinase
VKHRWQQVDQLFHSALEREPSERSAFLAEACAGDRVLRDEVESLLASHEQAGSFIEAPAADVAAELFADNKTALAAGRTLGPYKIVALLGAGGMGEVYLAQDTRLGRKIALKLLPARFTKDEDRLHRFEREARAASGLNHPNIVTIHEIGRVDGAHFIITEFIEGETLRQRMAGKVLKLRESLDAAIQMAGALGAAHKAGIVHRDIKPENIMLRPDGLVKILDFGLAKLTQQQQPGTESEASALTIVDTRIGLVMGTVTYMSPEQARGLAVDARSDIFSLGIVIYEMIAGRAPFDGATTSDVIVSILEKQPPPLAQYAPEVPTDLESIVEKALAKDRDGRYQTAENLMIDLKSLNEELELKSKLGAAARAGSVDVGSMATGFRLSVETDEQLTNGTGQAKAARATSSAEYLIGEIKKHKRAAALGLVTLVIAAIAGLLFLSMNKAKPPVSSVVMKTIAVLPFKPLAADSRNESLEMGMADTLINKLSPISQVIVRPISAIRRYTALEQDPIAAGRELRVDYVLEGNLQIEGEKTRATVRLLSVKDGSAVWTDKCDQACSNLFELQDAIAERIARSLSLQLTGEEVKQLTKHYTENAEAYQFYNLGMYHFRKFTREGFNKSIEYYAQAIKIDPNYAMAYVGLAGAYASLGQRGYWVPNEARQKYEWAALKAVELDDTLPSAHAVLGYVKKNNWDWAGAEQELKRGLELDPNSFDANFLYYAFLRDAGRPDEALPYAKRAEELGVVTQEPSVAVVYMFKRQYDTAVELFLEAIKRNPKAPFSHLRLGQIYLAKRMYAEGIAEIQIAMSLNNVPEELNGYPTLAYAYAMAGKRNEAMKILNQQKELAKRQYISPLNFAVIYTGLGDKDRAFEYLEKAYEERVQLLIHLARSPTFDSLRSDRRCEDLLQRMNLAP